MDLKASSLGKTINKFKKRTKKEVVIIDQKEYKKIWSKLPPTKRYVDASLLVKGILNLEDAKDPNIIYLMPLQGRA